MSSDSTVHAPRAPLPFLGLACAVGVSTIYYNQPLLLEMGHSYGATAGHTGFVAVATQVGYAAGLLLFVGHRTILAWGAQGRAWESPKLSDEGIANARVDGNLLRGLGWSLMTDKETPFALDLRTGRLKSGS